MRKTRTQYLFIISSINILAICNSILKKVKSKDVLEKFNTALAKAKFVVGQNVGFDLNIMGCEYHRLQVQTPLNGMPVLAAGYARASMACVLMAG